MHGAAERYRWPDPAADSGGGPKVTQSVLRSVVRGQDGEPPIVADVPLGSSGYVLAAIPGYGLVS